MRFNHTQVDALTRTLTNYHGTHDRYILANLVTFSFIYQMYYACVSSVYYSMKNTYTKYVLRFDNDGDDDDNIVLAPFLLLLCHSYCIIIFSFTVDYYPLKVFACVYHK